MPLYAGIAFLSAFLLFLVQPLLGKAILPWFGGAPAVWSTCLVFFQGMLLAGYAGAHVTSRLRPRQQAALYLGLLLVSLAQLPIAPPDTWQPDGHESPVPYILGLLTLSVGAPYLLMSATAPLVQRWASQDAGVPLPYRLYAVSNAGSLLGLLSYPFAIERLLTIDAQAVLWSVVYGVFAVLAGWLALSRVRARTADAARVPPADAADTGSPLPSGDRVLWLVLAASASGLLVATTSEISLNVAVIPFLWVLPLSLYLVTFMLAFAGWYPRRIVGWLLSAGLLAVAFLNLFYVPALWQIVAASVALFAGGWACHGELARQAPHTRHLTSFYLSVAGGGVIGGTLAALAAPVLFDEFWEYPLFLVLTAVSAFAGRRRRAEGGTPGRRAMFAPARLALVCLAVLTSYSWTMLWRSGETVVTARNFFGVLRVYDSEPAGEPAIRRFQHGRIVHGLQFLDPARRMEPNAYYTSQTGVAFALERHPRRAAGEPLRIGVLGLGVGTLAALGHPGDRMRFYELNPQVIAIARDYFTFLDETPAATEIVPGDARLSLEREVAAGLANAFDVLVVDAFSGDAVPVHLLTREAAALYWRALREGGILAVNVTNRYLNLTPVVRALAVAHGNEVVRVRSGGGDAGTLPSDWMLLTNNPAFLAAMDARDRRGHPAPEQPDAPTLLWTDSFSNLFDVLR